MVLKPFQVFTSSRYFELFGVSATHYKKDRSCCKISVVTYKTTRVPPPSLPPLALPPLPLLPPPKQLVYVRYILLTINHSPPSPSHTSHTCTRTHNGYADVAVAPYMVIRDSRTRCSPLRRIRVAAQPQAVRAQSLKIAHAQRGRTSGSRGRGGGTALPSAKLTS